MSTKLPPFAIALKQRQENQNIAPKARQYQQYQPEYEEYYTFVEDSCEYDNGSFDEMEPEINQKFKKPKKQQKYQNKGPQIQQKNQRNTHPPNVQQQRQNPPIDDQANDYLAEIEDYRNLLLDLQKKNSELENQVTNLTTENAKLLTAQQDLAKEKQLSEEYFKQIDELKEALRDEQLKSACLKDQVTQLESIVQSKNQQIEAKESMMHSLNIAYNQMVSEYQSNGLLVGTLTGQIRQYTKQVSELETQIAELKSAQRNQKLSKRYENCIDPGFSGKFDPMQQDDFAKTNPMDNNFPPLDNMDNGFATQPNALNNFDDFNPPINNFNTQPNGMNDFKDVPNLFNDPNQQFNDFNAQPNAMNDFNGNNNFFDDANLANPTNQMDNFGAPPFEMPTEATKAPVKRSALVDNINFIEPAVNALPSDELDIQAMSAQEMKEKLTSLQKERDEIERFLNKAPAKGRLLAHVNREKEEKEQQLDGIVKQISKIKYRLKVIKAL